MTDVLFFSPHLFLYNDKKSGIYCNFPRSPNLLATRTSTPSAGAQANEGGQSMSVFLTIETASASSDSVLPAGPCSDEDMLRLNS